MTEPEDILTLEDLIVLENRPAPQPVPPGNIDEEDI